jgi:hypothetical protein
VAAGYVWIGFALATSMRQYEAFMAPGRRALPERRPVFLSAAVVCGETTQRGGNAVLPFREVPLAGSDRSTLMFAVKWPRPEGRGFLQQEADVPYPRVRTMVLTLSLSISDVTLAETGNLAVLTPECLMPVGPSASLAAVNGHGSTLGPFRRNRAKHDFKQRSRVSAAPSRLQGWGLGRGDSR